MDYDKRITIDLIIFYNTAMGKRLFVFDFDQTIVDINSDVIILRMAREEGIIDKYQYREGFWQHYIQELTQELQKTYSVE